MLMDIKVSKSQFAKMIQLRVFLGEIFGKLDKLVLLDIAVPQRWFT